MSFWPLTIPGPTGVALAGRCSIFQDWMQRVSYARPISRPRAAFLVTCCLLLIGWGGLLRAEATDPQAVDLKRVQGSSADGPGIVSDTLQETPAGQDFKKADLDTGLDSLPDIQSINEAEELVETSRKERVNRSLSGVTPLPDGDGWQVVAGPAPTIKECHQELDQKIMAVTNQYVAEKLGREDAGQLLQIDADFVNSYLTDAVTESEVVNTSFGKWWRVTAVLRRRQSFQPAFELRWKNFQHEARLRQVGLGSSAILLLLVTTFGYLKLDAMTRGHRSGQLQLLAVGVILALCVAGVGVSRCWILWI